MFTDVLKHGKRAGALVLLALLVVALTACGGTFTDNNGNRWKVEPVAGTDQFKVRNENTGAQFQGTLQQLTQMTGMNLAPTAPSPVAAAASPAPANSPSATVRQAGPGASPPAGGSAVAPSPSPSASLTNTPNVVVRLMDGRSPEERRTVEGNYEDTGVLKPGTKTWQRQVAAGDVAFVFGVSFKDETGNTHYDDGFMRVYEGPTTFHVTVTDGAYKIVPTARAEGEVCVRYAQHVKEGWLMNNYDGPPKYNPAQICR